MGVIEGKGGKRFGLLPKEVPVGGMLSLDEGE